ncbi:MAG TPA: hypothetical protein P5572_08175 [Phycisphaerae bacterium]|nr:hypothetical protein [Phycisphaerales bacterium]HRX84979.1 hypothetical protein [Phycisphaerae bacterium]
MRNLHARGLFVCSAAVAVCAALSTAPALADGTETLGAPAVPLMLDGSGFVAAGTGLLNQPNTIEIDVPAGATINQVLLYWAGELRAAPGDAITVNGTPVAGTLIGGPTFFYDYQGEVDTASYRADITALDAVAPGPNVVNLDGLSYDWDNSGAGIVVLYDDGATTADTQIVDGIDIAYYAFPDPRQDTVPQTFSFAAADVDRVAKLGVFVGAVQPDSPHTLDITVDGVTDTLVDPLGSLDGPTWDTLLVPVDIPAGATEATVQLHSTPSTDPIAASLLWVAAAFSVPLPEATGGECVECAGGVTALTLRNDDRRSQYVNVWGFSGRRAESFFRGWVGSGDEFSFAADDVNEELPTYLFVQYGWRIALLRTDCRWDIRPGTRQDNFTVIEAINVGGEPLCPVEEQENLCALGRPAALTLQYNGASCGHDDFSFSPLHLCQGDPESADPVYIVASSDLNPFSHHTTKWFEGTVNLGDTFVVDAANGGRDHLGYRTWLTIYDADPAQGGHRLQRVALRTSCSRPISLGTTFGAFELVDYLPE